MQSAWLYTKKPEYNNDCPPSFVPPESPCWRGPYTSLCRCSSRPANLPGIIAMMWFNYRENDLDGWWIWKSKANLSFLSSPLNDKTSSWQSKQKSPKRAKRSGWQGPGIEKSPKKGKNRRMMGPRSNRTTTKSTQGRDHIRTLTNHPSFLLANT